jgi:multiple sugar transport system permease protein
MADMGSHTRSRRRVDPMGYLFVAPYVIYFLVFVAFPVGFAFFLTVHQWNIVSPEKPFVGARNFVRLMNDELFWTALRNTFRFIVMYIPLQIALALLLAVVLNERLPMRAFFRTAFFLPFVTSGAIISVIWSRLYADDGALNKLLGAAGLGPVGWISSPELAMFSIAIMAAWKNVGYYMMIFLAALQAIPATLYEDAVLAGASPWQRFRYITLPLLNPAIVLVMVLCTIAAFSLFVEPFVMTGGGPLDSTLSVVLLLYREAFQYLRMGYAATIGVVLASIIFVVTYFQRRVVEQEVSY